MIDTNLPLLTGAPVYITGCTQGLDLLNPLVKDLQSRGITCSANSNSLDCPRVEKTGMLKTVVLRGYLPIPVAVITICGCDCSSKAILELLATFDTVILSVKGRTTCVLRDGHCLSHYTTAKECLRHAISSEDRLNKAIKLAARGSELVTFIKRFRSEFYKYLGSLLTPDECAELKATVRTRINRFCSEMGVSSSAFVGTVTRNGGVVSIDLSMSDNTFMSLLTVPTRLLVGQLEPVTLPDLFS